MSGRSVVEDPALAKRRAHEFSRLIRNLTDLVSEREARSEHFRANANCRGMDPNAFVTRDLGDDPGNPAARRAMTPERQEARRVCAKCTVSDECPFNLLDRNRVRSHRV